MNKKLNLAINKSSSFTTGMVTGMVMIASFFTLFVEASVQTSARKAKKSRAALVHAVAPVIAAGQPDVVTTHDHLATAHDVPVVPVVEVVDAAVSPSNSVDATVDIIELPNETVAVVRNADATNDDMIGKKEIIIINKNTGLLQRYWQKPTMRYLTYAGIGVGLAAALVYTAKNHGWSLMSAALVAYLQHRFSNLFGSNKATTEKPNEDGTVPRVVKMEGFDGGLETVQPDKSQEKPDESFPGLVRRKSSEHDQDYSKDDYDPAFKSLVHNLQGIPQEGSKRTPSSSNQSAVVEDIPQAEEPGNQFSEDLPVTVYLPVQAHDVIGATSKTVQNAAASLTSEIKEVASGFADEIKTDMQNVTHIAADVVNTVKEKAEQITQAVTQPIAAFKQADNVVQASVEELKKNLYKEVGETKKDAEIIAHAVQDATPHAAHAITNDINTIEIPQSVVYQQPSSSVEVQKAELGQDSQIVTDNVPLVAKNERQQLLDENFEKQRAEAKQKRAKIIEKELRREMSRKPRRTKSTKKESQNDEGKSKFRRTFEPLLKDTSEGFGLIARDIKNAVNTEKVNQVYEQGKEFVKEFVEDVGAGAQNTGKEIVSTLNTIQEGNI